MRQHLGRGGHIQDVVDAIRMPCARIARLLDPHRSLNLFSPQQPAFVRTLLAGSPLGLPPSRTLQGSPLSLPPPLSAPIYPPHSGTPTAPLLQSWPSGRRTACPCGAGAISRATSQGSSRASKAAAVLDVGITIEYVGGRAELATTIL
mmetsp:Transcript_7515/g.19726  ORF Transcript_7515/g.19726 Transcript_7515/m.19726 type:complete len:148 (-) Transcript_7515:638-1081(-)